MSDSPPPPHGDRRPRKPRIRRRDVIAAALTLALAGGIAFLVLRGDGRPTTEDLPAETATPVAPDPLRVDLAGAPPAKGSPAGPAGPPPEGALPSDEVRGRVVDVQGRPIAGAQLWFVPRGGRTATSVASQGPTSDAEGRFGPLFVDEVRGRRIRVERAAREGSPSFLPAVLDDLRWGSDVEVVLEEGRRIAVEVLDVHGDPVPGAEVSGMDQATLDAPVFGSSASGWIGACVVARETDAEGRAVLSVPTRGPALVWCAAPARQFGFVPSPPRVVAGPESGAVTFRLVPACPLRVRCVDALTDALYRGEVAVAIDQGERTPVVAGLPGLFDLEPDANGILEWIDVLPEGRYRITVSAPGRRDAVTPMLEGRAGTLPAQATLRLVPEGGGAIQIHVHSPLRVPSSWPAAQGPAESPSAPVLWLRRTDADRGPWTQAPPADTTWILPRSVVSVRRVPPGTYAVYLFEPASACAGFLPAVHVAEGLLSLTSARLRPGARPRVATLLPGATWVRRLRVRTAEFDDLPVLVGASATTLLGAEEWLTPSTPVAVLPFDELDATFEAPDGSTRTTKIPSE